MESSPFRPLMVAGNRADVRRERGGVALTRFVGAQAAYLLGKMSRPMVLAIHDGLDAETQVYLRTSRERMLKATLEQVAADPETSVAAAREATKG